MDNIAAKNSITGRFRDIEILFSIDGDATIMSVRNLVNTERKVRVMYQKLSMSGLANWTQFKLTDTPESLRLPTEILEAYRLTFFVDEAEPVSARVEKILDELKPLRSEAMAEKDPEPAAESPAVPQDEVREPVLSDPAVPPTVNQTGPSAGDSDAAEPFTPEHQATQHVKAAVTLPPPSEVHTAESVLTSSEQVPKEKSVPTPIVLKLPAPQQRMLVSSIVDSNLEFKIAVPSLPPSALAAQRKAQAATHLDTAAKTGKTSLNRKKKGVFGRISDTLGLTAGGRRGKAYYQEKGQDIQDEFQDQLAKLERDYNEGYGLNLLNWDRTELNEAEIAIWLLNLMVNEVNAWQKETERDTPKTELLVDTLDEVDERLRQTLKQTRRSSAPSPTLFPDLLAENERDLEKIQNECDAYLQRFGSKLIELEKNHAEKIEVVIFKKFLIEFIRGFLFIEVAKSTPGNALPERLNWFLDLVDSEVIPIEIGRTKVSPNYHKVKGARPCEFETGTVAEVVTAGLQSKDERRIPQRAVVIVAE